MKPWMIYGANGFTGRLLAVEAVRRGYQPVLAGRRPADVQTLAESLGCESRIFSLDQPQALRDGLDGMWAVLHCAGPFSHTALPMLRGCMASKTHYLDITGEIGVFENIWARQKEIKEAGIVAIPGVGFDVVPSDCLAAQLVAALPNASHLSLAIAMDKGGLSPGTAKTMVEWLGEGGAVRRDGKIVRTPAAHKTREIAFAHQTLTTVCIPWGDVATAFHSTAIPNIEVYMAAPPPLVHVMRLAGRMSWLWGQGLMQSLLKSLVQRHVKGPSEQERARGSIHLWGEVQSENGQQRCLRLHVPEGYDFTVASALLCLEKLDATSLSPGYYTPSRAFGAGLVQEIPDVVGPL